jgi:guanyl-specific ribonuclease Sa
MAQQRPIPPEAFVIADYVQQHNGNTLSGYQGNIKFKNREGKLPDVDTSGAKITYTEYDIVPHTPGVNRGTQRIVIGLDGKRYYTDDHYTTFTEF